MTEEQRRVRLLQQLYDYRPSEPGSIPEVVDLLGEVMDGHDEELWRSTLRGLAHENLITLHESLVLDSWSMNITSDGRSIVESRRKRLEDPALRWQAALTAVLRWLYDQSAEGPVWLQTGSVAETDYALFEGDYLPKYLLYRAAEQLKNDGLIEAGEDGGELGGPLIIRLARAGRECVDAGGNVTEYLRQTRQPAGNVWNIHSMSGNLAVDSTYVTQTVITNSGLDADQLKVLLAAMLEALPALPFA